MIHAPIPLGRIAVQDALPWEMLALAGPLYANGAGSHGLPARSRTRDRALSPVRRGRFGSCASESCRRASGGHGRRTGRGERRRRVTAACFVGSSTAFRVACTKPRRTPCLERSGWPSRVSRVGSSAPARRRLKRDTSAGIMMPSGSRAHSPVSPWRTTRWSSRSGSRRRVAAREKARQDQRAGRPTLWRKALRRPAHGTASVFSSN